MFFSRWIAAAVRGAHNKQHLHSERLVKPGETLSVLDTGGSDCW
jgi:hypothetical protein